MAQKGFALLVPVPSLIRLSHIRPQRPRAVGEADGELKIATEPPPFFLHCRLRRQCRKNGEGCATLLG